MRQFEIKVYLNFSAYKDGKFIFRHCVNAPAGVVFEFEKVLSVMHMFYGADCVVSFVEI